jgi:membrane protease YdiL (CAAX protease family)
MARRSAARRLSLPSGLFLVLRLTATTFVYLAILAIAYGIAITAGLTLAGSAAEGAFGLLGLGVAEGAAMAAVLVIWRFVDGHRLESMGLRSTGAVGRCLRGALTAALMMGFVVLVGFSLIDRASWDINPDVVRAGLALLVGLVGFGIQGPSEEVLFRGYILEHVRAEWGVRWAVIISSLSFAFLHMRNPAFGLLPFLNLILFGLGTALYKLYVDDGQLWGVFAIHTIWNWLQQVVFGLPNSGLSSVPDNTLFTVAPDTTLPAPLWGGGFGPEGTIVATLVLLALISFAWRRADSTRAAAARDRAQAS